MRPPAELRNNIYEAAFSSSVIRIRREYLWTDNVNIEQISGGLSLRATCHQTRYQSEWVFYQNYILDLGLNQLFNENRIADLFKTDNRLFIEKIEISFNAALWMMVQTHGCTLKHRHSLACLFPRLKHVYVGMSGFSCDLCIADIRAAARFELNRLDLELHEAMLMK